MYKLFLSFFCLLALTISISLAQTVTSFGVEGNEVVITYNLDKVSGVYNVTAYYSTDNQKTWIPCQTVRGDVKGVKPGPNKNIYWDWESDVRGLGEVAFKVDLNKVANVIPFVGYNVNLHEDSFEFLGIRGGVNVGAWGGYLSFASNPDDFYFTLLVGGNRRIISKGNYELRFFAGAGLGCELDLFAFETGFYQSLGPIFLSLGFFSEPSSFSGVSMSLGYEFK